VGATADLKTIIASFEDEYDAGAPIDEIAMAAVDELDMDDEGARRAIEKLRRQGDVYEPTTDHLRVV